MNIKVIEYLIFVMVDNKLSILNVDKKSYPQTLTILSFFIHKFNSILNILKNICNIFKNIVYYNSQRRRHLLSAGMRKCPRARVFAVRRMSIISVLTQIFNDNIIY